MQATQDVEQVLSMMLAAMAKQTETLDSLLDIQVKQLEALAQIRATVEAGDFAVATSSRQAPQ